MDSTNGFLNLTKLLFQRQQPKFLVVSRVLDSLLSQLSRSAASPLCQLRPLLEAKDETSCKFCESTPASMGSLNQYFKCVGLPPSSNQSESDCARPVAIVIEVEDREIVD